MTISILVEPSQAGFRATTGGPLDLSAEAASAAEAISVLHEKFTNRLQGGAILIDHPVCPPRPPIPVLPLSENPLFDARLAAVENYRTERESLESFNERESKRSMAIFLFRDYTHDRVSNDAVRDAGQRQIEREA